MNKPPEFRKLRSRSVPLTPIMKPPPQKSQHNILNILNPDCWNHIFSFLPLHDLLRSERVSRQWRLAVLERLKRQRKFDNRGNRALLTDTNCDHLLRKIGLNLTQLCLDTQIYRYTTTLTWVIARSCPNLQELSCANLFLEKSEVIFKKCSKLKTAVFINCTGIEDKVFKFFKGEKLVLHGIYSVTAHFLSQMKSKNLTTLHFVDCANLECEHLINGWSVLNRLESLTLDRCSSQVNFFLDELVMACPNLKEFSNQNPKKAYDIPNMECLSQNSKLQLLHVSHNKYVNKSFMQSVAHSCRDIASLDLTGCRKLSLADINIVWKMKNLQYLNLSELYVCPASFDSLGIPSLSSSGTTKLKTFICRDCHSLIDDFVSQMVLHSPDLTVIDIGNCALIDGTCLPSINEAVSKREKKQMVVYIRKERSRETSAIKKLFNDIPDKCIKLYLYSWYASSQPSSNMMFHYSNNCSPLSTDDEDDDYDDESSLDGFLSDEHMDTSSDENDDFLNRDWERGIFNLWFL